MNACPNCGYGDGRRSEMVAGAFGSQWLAWGKHVVNTCPTRGYGGDRRSEMVVGAIMNSELVY